MVGAVCACRSVGRGDSGLTSLIISCSITATSRSALHSLAHWARQHRIGGVMSTSDAPVLAGVHHLKLPVSDLARSIEWYRSRLGYAVEIEFVEQGTLMGVALNHP